MNQNFCHQCARAEFKTDGRVICHAGKTVEWREQTDSRDLAYGYTAATGCAKAYRPGTAKPARFSRPTLKQAAKVRRAA